MPFWPIMLSILLFFWDLFKIWGYTFFVSFTHGGTIWIIIPIWLSWFFAEFFQEKKGTSFGNAISNGVVPLWVGIDWMRQLTTILIETQAKLSMLVFSKYIISVLVICYGLIIIVGGIRGSEFVRYFGRIREVSYILAAFTPFVYELIAPGYKYFLAIVIFFPMFYFLIELIDRVTPEPVVLSKDKGTEEDIFKDLGSFNQQINQPTGRSSRFPPLR